MSQYTLTDGIVDAFCTLLSPYVKKGMMEHENEYGIDVLFNRTDKGLLMFRFISKEELEIQLPLELDRLAKEGRDYLHGRIELLEAMIPKALEERQKDQTIYLDTAPPAQNRLKDAMFAEPERKQGVVTPKVN